MCIYYFTVHSNEDRALDSQTLALCSYPYPIAEIRKIGFGTRDGKPYYGTRENGKRVVAFGTSKGNIVDAKPCIFSCIFKDIVPNFKLIVIKRIACYLAWVDMEQLCVLVTPSILIRPQLCFLCNFKELIGSSACFNLCTLGLISLCTVHYGKRADNPFILRNKARRRQNKRGSMK